MRQPTLSVIAAVTLLGVAACGDQHLTSPHRDVGEFAPAPADPMASANTNCVWSPSGEISIPAGTYQTFTPSNFSDCNGSYAVIQASGAGVLGHLVPAGTCTTAQGTVPPFKVKKCLAGSGVIKIYTSSSQTTLIQTIGIDREL
jgi:hypothetical protein